MATTNTSLCNTPGVYIMKENYVSTNSATFRSIILTEDGKGLTFETGQSPSSIPISKLNTTDNSLVNQPFTQVDKNITVTSAVKLPLTTGQTQVVGSYLQANRTDTNLFEKVEYVGDYSNYAKVGDTTFVKPLNTAAIIPTVNNVTVQPPENFTIDPNLLIKGGGLGTGTRDTSELGLRRLIN